ncbi:hypothetical protein CRG98_021345 [Punica granatum]|uniref:Uncharacterized protein n=1 Tax=Punica granatum TaxID=22663 RepID=A0A2I0JQS5_PUNGR|nr:hypothetical protein CRG98_021345 [Punica granatum]
MRGHAVEVRSSSSKVEVRSSLSEVGDRARGSQSRSWGRGRGAEASTRSRNGAADGTSCLRVGAVSLGAREFYSKEPPALENSGSGQTFFHSRKGGRRRPSTTPTKSSAFSVVIGDLIGVIVAADNPPMVEGRERQEPERGERNICGHGGGCSTKKCFTAR